MFGVVFVVGLFGFLGFFVLQFCLLFSVIICKVVKFT